jgi:formate hydrogenlyase subunit 3/multisubunit Na+/H+ antiporter MnhD subunit
MKKNGWFVLSGLLFMFLGSCISSLGFVGIILLGKVTGKVTNGETSFLIECLFISTFGLFLVILCWATGKFIVPRYKGQGKGQGDRFLVPKFSSQTP